MNPVVASDKLKRTEVWAEDDDTVHWAGAFAVYGGHGTTASSTIVYEIEPGKRLGWHTDATEETQYIIAGTGELHMEDGSVHRVGPGSVFVLPTPVKHDLVNVGNETLRAVAFFAAAMFTQNFDNVMMPPKSHILGTPNHEGWGLARIRHELAFGKRCRLRFTARFSAFVSTPKDFVSQISDDEWKNLRDQIGTPSWGHDIAAACGQYDYERSKPSSFLPTSHRRNFG